MNPGDRVRNTHTDNRGFVLYKSNIGDDQVLVRFDGNDYNSVCYEDKLEVLPSEPFRQGVGHRPVVTVTYHLSYWPYKSKSDPRSTKLHSPGMWTPPMGAFVTEVVVD